MQLGQYLEPWPVRSRPAPPRGGKQGKKHSPTTGEWTSQKFRFGRGGAKIERTRCEDDARGRPGTLRRWASLVRVDGAGRPSRVPSLLPRAVWGRTLLLPSRPVLNCGRRWGWTRPVHLVPPPSSSPPPSAGRPDSRPRMGSLSAGGDGAGGGGEGGRKWQVSTARAGRQRVDSAKTTLGSPGRRHSRVGRSQGPPGEATVLSR